MSAVLHMSRIVKFGSDKQWTRTTTLCNRMRSLNDGMNIADKREQVTCKLCLREIARRERIGVTIE